MDAISREAVGAGFSIPAMLRARNLSLEAVERIAQAIRPGMTQGQATDIATQVLQQLGMQRIWHRTLVRFGRDTLKIFNEPVAAENVLGDNDIFFIDIGPVWDGHEGDAGDTFVLGNDPEMAACAEAARRLWCEVSDRWRQDGLSGEALYRFAEERTQALGWRLNLDVKGHRVCDFPHAIYKAGNLGDFGLCPSTGVWVLEIQIAHPQRPFGTFYEDMLIADPIN
ncbi:MAG: aminopeptidase P family protein [Burkholderiales bacterium]|nr:aminopeptidase P family protein [Burkholderiales bacterium]